VPVGDVLILGKGWGGVWLALKEGMLSAEGYAQMIATTTPFNAVGSKLSGLNRCHALTDVTGSAARHLLEFVAARGWLPS